jgi:alkanesulfonate monooxygenase SsuD/methylene tetrahydromethanopterin reductase-like flavin-dependent oxidoreductase (luciferase family)
MAAPTMTPAPAAPYPRIVAANGQKMMALAGELADGALPRTWQSARTTSYSCPPAPPTAT